MQFPAFALGKNGGHVIWREAVVAVANIVADQDFTMLGDNGFGIGTANVTHDVAYLFPILRAMISHWLRIVEADALGIHVLVEEADEQVFGVEFEQLGGLDGGGQ